MPLLFCIFWRTGERLENRSPFQIPDSLCNSTHTGVPSGYISPGPFPRHIYLCFGKKSQSEIPMSGFTL